MRKIVVALALTLISFSAFAQKPSVNKASRYLKKGELNEAKEQIDLTVDSEKYHEDDKAWYTKGEIYEAIAKQGEETDKETLLTAVAAYRKAQELAGEGKTYNLFSEQKINKLWNEYVNLGVEAYNNNDLENAIPNFEMAGDIKPQDSTGYLYAASAAHQLEDWQRALPNYYNVLGTDYSKKEEVYSTIIYVESAVNDDQEKALEVVREAKVKFPENKDFVQQEIDLLIKTDQVEAAQNELTAAIESEPDNPKLYFNRGALYDGLGNKEKALNDYLKAVELDANYFDALFNTGVIYYNRGADLLKQANDMDLKTYQKKGAKLEKKAKAEFNNALPYMEKCAEIQPEDKVTLSTLQTLYGQLRMYEKAEKVNNRMKDLGYSN